MRAAADGSVEHMERSEREPLETAPANRAGGLRGALGLVARSFGEASAAWAGVICAGFLLTLAATVVGERIGGHAGYLFGEFRFGGQYAGVMTVVSTCLLGAAGLSLLTVAWILARAQATRRLAVPWVVTAIGMFALATDDLLFIHELVAYRLADRGVPFAIGENLLLAAYAAGAMLVLPRLIETVRRYWRAAFPLAFGLAMFATTIALDFTPTESVGPAMGWVLSLVDHAGKLLGTAMMLLSAQVLLVDVARHAGRPDP